jgi:hypothetical protein
LVVDIVPDQAKKRKNIDFWQDFFDSSTSDS